MTNVNVGGAPPPTMADIVAAKNAALVAIAQAHAQLQARINALMQKAGSGTPLTSSEYWEAQKAMDGIDALAVANIKLRMDFASFVNDSSALAGLTAEIKSASTDLKDRLKALESIAATLAVIADVIAAVARVAGLLAKFVI